MSHVIYRNIMVPMRDGVQLATDIYLPADNASVTEPIPAVFCRTPYVKESARYVEIADFFLPKGYAVVLQDLRGRNHSEGLGQYYHVANDEEGHDGYDSIEWIAEQKWSNGKVGMVGSSFAALVQIRAAFENPPHLKAIWPDVTPTNSYHNQAREGGAMQLHMFWALFLHAQDAQEIIESSASQDAVWQDLGRLRELLLDLPFKPGQTALAKVPPLEKTLFDYYQRGTYDSYWKRECHDFERNQAQHADIPGTFTGGWYDPFSDGMTRYFSALDHKNSTPQHLIMGPWTHVSMRGDTSYLGEVDFGADSIWGVKHLFEQQHLFFEPCLTNHSPEAKPEYPIRIFVMGGGSGKKNALGKLDHGGQWRNEKQWPLPQTNPMTFYFHQEGTLSNSPPTEKHNRLSYTYDPEQPVPTLGGNMCGLMEMPTDREDLDPMWCRYLHPVTRLRHITPIGPVHQKETPLAFGCHAPYPLLRDRPDILSFESTPLSHPVEVTGCACVNLWISSTATDTDFTAKLVDVYPPSEDYPEGFHLNLVDSIIRTRYRESWEQETFMNPGVIYRVVIQLPPTSNLFQASHRIRLDISSSNFPRLDPNPNTGEPIGRHTHTQKTDNTLYLNPDYPSHLILPVIP